MQHRREDYHDADALESCRIAILGLDEIRQRLRQRAIVSNAAGEYDIDAVAHAFVHDAAGEESALDRCVDAARTADRVDRADVMAVAAFHSAAAIEIDSERGAVERLLQVVNRECVAGEQHLYISAADQIGEVSGAAGVDCDWPGDERDSAAGRLDLPHQPGDLRDADLDA